jgi:hypothetical protein
MTKTKTLTALAAAATLGLAAIAAPQPAEAGHWHGGWGGGGAVAAGVIGGLAAGYYAYAPGPYYGGGCYWTRQRIWDGWNWRIRRVRVCN